MWFAGQGAVKSSAMKRDMLSPCYTTRAIPICRSLNNKARILLALFIRGYTSAFSVASASGGNTSPLPRFCRRCATEEVPDQQNVPENAAAAASAPCIGVAPWSSATACSPEDCSGGKTAQREERHIS